MAVTNQREPEQRDTQFYLGRLLDQRPKFLLNIEKMEQILFVQGQHQINFYFSAVPT